MPSKVVLRPLKGQVKNISEAEAKQMVARGRAYQPSPKLSPGVYFEKVPSTATMSLEPEPEPEPELEPEPVRDQTYETRTMEAAAPAAPRRRSYRKTGTPKD